ncbi:two-component system sensor kinase [Sulfuriferula nivalis]|uniref:histidine kinase n=1 Tax=Sulfuriferula nivalis TaxID=2675298 RepID=A0A809RKF8_9PROT|nr:two-component system sensor kinase [Sulfuriferula nivalis]
MPSLKKSLLTWLLIPLLSLLTLASVGAFYVADKSATSAFDKALLDPIQVLSQHIQLQKGAPPIITLSPESLHSLFTDAYDSVYYQVVSPTNKLYTGTLNLSVPSNVGYKPQFYSAKFKGRDIRVAAIRLTLDGSDDDVIVQIAETLTKRDRNLYETLLIMILPSIIITLAAVVLVGFGISRGLVPLQKLKNEITRRSLNDLRAVPESNVPIEVLPVVHALNNLLSNLEAAIDGQQRFLANAAHQLRTPLAGLQTQVELALRMDMPADVHAIFTQLLDATQRATHLANQLLTLARVEPGAMHLVSMQRLDLAQLVEPLIGLMLVRAQVKKLDLGFELSETVVTGDKLLLTELITNLLDNAIRYTLENGYITVRCYQTAAGAVLEVEDNGLGIPESLRRRVLERFYRVDGSPGNGCGLGLAIVDEIAKLHGATLEILTPELGRGTRMVVRFSPVVT